MKKIIIPLLALTIQNVGLSSSSLKQKEVNVVEETSIKLQNDQEDVDLARIKADYLTALEPYYSSSSNSGVSLLTNENLDITNFYRDFPMYNEGGMPISLSNSYYPCKTKLSDIQSRYYDVETGNCIYHLVKNFDFKDEKFGDVNLNMRQSEEFFTTSTKTYSPSFTAAGLNILKSMSYSHNLERPAESGVISTTPYILNARLGHDPKDRPDDFLTSFSSTTYSSEKEFTKGTGLQFSQDTYKGFPLVIEEPRDNHDRDYVYNQLCKMATVMDSSDSDKLIDSLDTYLKENSLSTNEKHRFTVTGKRSLITTLDVQEDLINYLNSGDGTGKSGAIAIDDDFVLPRTIGTPHTEAIVIVGYGVTTRVNATTDKVQKVAELIFDVGGGVLAAMPAFDLTYWYDLTIKKQNKEWFGWRTSTDEKNWYRG